MVSRLRVCCNRRSRRSLRHDDEHATQKGGSEMARPAGASARHNGMRLDEGEERYHGPLAADALTHKRCQLAQELLALDHQEFLQALDTNEEEPAYITLAAQ